MGKVLDLVVFDSRCLAVASGMVTDAVTGAPVAEAFVTRDPVQFEGKYACTTGSNGEFDLDNGRCPLGERFGLQVQHQDYVTVHTGRVYPWDGSAIRIELTAKPRFSLIVRDGATRVPVTEFGVVLVAKAPLAVEALVRPRVSHMGTHANGAVEISYNRPGLHRLIVVPPAESRYMASHEHTLDLAPAIVHEVELWPAKELLVHVKSESGDVVDGALVEVLGPLDSCAVDSRSLSVTLDNLAADDHPRTRSFQFASARSDRNGVTVVRLPAGGASTVRAAKDGYLSAIAPAPASAIDRLDLILRRGVTVRLAARPPAVITSLRMSAHNAFEEPAAKLYSEGDDFARSVPAAGAEYVGFDEHGRCTIEGVPPGRWAVGFRAASNRGRFGRQTREEFVLRDLAVGAEGPVQVDLDLSRYSQHAFSMRLEMGGRSLAGAKLELIPRPADDRPATAATAFGFEADAAGIVSGDVPPGRYSVRVSHPALGLPDNLGFPVRHDYRVGIGAGNGRDIIGIEGRPLTIRPQEGTAPAERICLVNAAHRWSVWLPLDAAGRGVLPLAPVGELTALVLDTKRSVIKVGTALVSRESTTAMELVYSLNQQKEK